MKTALEERVMSREHAVEYCRQRAREGQTVVFTNGCFDLLHAGHLRYLSFARDQGDCLVVGLNSDASVRRAKGATRPVVGEQDRALLLAALRPVDIVVLFDEDEPRELIAALQPDVLVKGEDWAHYVCGREIVEARGGQVVLAPLVAGLSTTGLIERIGQARALEEEGRKE